MKIVKKEGRIVGTFTDKFVALAPVPTGDAFDELLDGVCTRIESHPRLGTMGRMHPDLRPDHGRISPMLSHGLDRYQWAWDATDKARVSRHGGGVAAWITNGTLREDGTYINALLTEYADLKDQQCRRSKIPTDWQFTVEDVWMLGKKFGLAGPPPPPTPEELAKKKAEYEESLRREADRVQTSRKIEQDAASDWRKKTLLRQIAVQFYPMDDDLDLTGDNVPAEVHEVNHKRRIFRQYSKALVDHLVDEKRTDDEIMEEMTMLHAVIQGDWKSSVPEPLQPNQTRHLVTPKEMARFVCSIDHDAYDSSTCLCMDGRFSVTITKKGEDHGYSN